MQHIQHCLSDSMANVIYNSIILNRTGEQIFLSITNLTLECFVIHIFFSLTFPNARSGLMIVLCSNETPASQVAFTAVYFCCYFHKASRTNEAKQRMKDESRNNSQVHNNKQNRSESKYFTRISLDWSILWHSNNHCVFININKMIENQSTIWLSSTQVI